MNVSEERETFQRQFNARIVEIQSNYQLTEEMIHGLGDRIEEFVEDRIIKGIAKEVKKNITITRREVPRYGPIGSSDEPREEHSARVFFMSEDTFSWMIHELRMLFNDKDNRRL